MYKSSDFETSMFDGKPILGKDGLPIPRQRRGPQEKQMKITVVGKKTEQAVEDVEMNKNEEDRVEEEKKEEDI